MNKNFWWLLHSLPVSTFPLGDSDDSVTDNRKRPHKTYTGSPMSWDRFKYDYPSDDEIEGWMSAWPKCNVGIVTGKLSNVIVIDTDTPQAEIWWKTYCPETPVYVKTGKGIHHYYKWSEQGEKLCNDIRKYVNRLPDIHVDFQNNGHYVVSGESVHSSGKIYEPFGFNKETWDKRPEFSCSWKIEDGIALPTSSKKEASTTQTNNIVSGVTYEGNRNNHVAQRAGQLFSDGVPLYDAIDQIERENGVDIIPPLDHAEIIAVCRSIYKRDLQQRASKYTSSVYKQELKIGDVLVGDMPPDTAHDWDGVKAVEPNTQFTPWPDFLYKPTGLLGRIVDYIKSISTIPNPVYSFGAALALLGICYSQRVKTITGLRTSGMYVVCVGPSGSGKDAPKRGVRKLLEASKMASYFGGTTIASSASIITALHKYGRQLFTFDEFGMFLQNTKNKNGHLADVPSLLMQLHSAYDTGYKKPYASEEDELTLPWLALNIIGFSTPLEFWGKLSTDTGANGLLARLWVFDDEDADNRFDINHIAGDYAPDEYLLSLLDDILESLPDGTVGKVGDTNVSLIPEPQVMEFQYVASEFDRHIRQEVHKKVVHCDTEFERAIWNRVREQALKVAMIIELSLRGFGFIEIDSYKTAYNLAVVNAQRAIQKAQSWLHDSEFEGLCQKVLRSLSLYLGTEEAKKKGHKGAPMCRIEHYLSAVSSKTVHEVIDKLVDTNKLRVIESANKRGKKCSLYVPVVEDEEN